MKSYLAGNPELRLALNEDLVVGGKGEEGYGKVVLDDLNFNECVNLAGEGKEGKVGDVRGGRGGGEEDVVVVIFD